MFLHRYAGVLRYVEVEAVTLYAGVNKAQKGQTAEAEGSAGRFRAGFAVPAVPPPLLNPASKSERR